MHYLIFSDRNIIIKELLIIIFPALISFQTIDAQVVSIQRNVMGTGGSSGTFFPSASNFFIQQVVGQSGLTGLTSGGYYLLRQGFIQPPVSKVTAHRSVTLTADIYPNPASDKILISLADDIPESYYVSIYDMTGKIVHYKYYKSGGITEIDISDFPPAIYLVRVFTTTKSFYSRITRLQ